MGNKRKRKKPKKTKELKKLLKEKEKKLNRLCQSPEKNPEEIKKLASEIILINQEIASKYRRNIPSLPITDPHLREIDEKYAKNILMSITPDLKCPKCGDRFRGNTLNGKPWCFKCNMELTKGGKPPPKTSKDKYPKDVTFKPLDVS